jgi:hypothetical protein
VAVLDEKGKVVSNSGLDNNLIKVNEFFDTCSYAGLIPTTHSSARITHLGNTGSKYLRSIMLEGRL